MGCANCGNTLTAKYCVFLGYERTGQDRQFPSMQGKETAKPYFTPLFIKGGKDYE